MVCPDVSWYASTRCSIPRREQSRFAKSIPAGRYEAMPSSIVMPINSISRRLLKNSTRRAAVVLESLPPLMPIAMRSWPRRWTWDRSSRFARRSTKPRKWSRRRCSPQERDRDRDHQGDESAENPRGEHGPEERPPMTFGESPASHQAGRRGRVLHHNGGRVEAHGDAHIEGDQASDGEQDEAAADCPDR